MASAKYYGTGRRKKSIARVYLVPGTGKVTINKRDIDEYFGLETLKVIVRQPLAATETADKFDVIVNVHGGGYTGQAGAPQGFRPLCLGKTANGYVLSSESCAFDAIKAEFIRHIDPGEMVIIDDSGVRSTMYAEPEKIDKKLCVFEYIYFARGDSHIDGQSVYQSRLNMGRELYNETKYDADIVMSIPDSGTTAALGYARASGIPFAEGLVKNRYSGRTFIKPNQEERELAVRMKLNPLPHVVSGKRIVLIDDSIVRGTTSGIIVKMLKEAGAKEVYMCVSSPSIEYSCHYGIDTSVRKELIAATHTVDEIKDYIHADKLHYLSREGLCRAVSDIAPNDLCFACFNGDYSVEVPAEQEEGVKYVLE